jgi:hypothetical protein
MPRISSMLAGAVAGVFVCSMVCSTAAAGTVNITPQQTRLAIAPGGLDSRTITLSNDTEAPVACGVEIADWTVGGGTAEGLRYYPPGTQERSCSGWLKARPEDLRLAPGEQQEISISITLPDTARGSYFSALTVNVQPDRPAPAEGTSLQARPTAQAALILGHLITVDTEGRTTWAASVDTFYVPRPDDTRPLELRAVISNQGNAGIQPEGSFAIVDTAGASVGKVDMRAYYAQPGGVMQISETWNGLLEPGAYRVIGTIDIGGGQFLSPELKFEVVNEVEISEVRVAEAPGGLEAIVKVDNRGNITSILSSGLEVQDESGDLMRAMVGDDIMVLPGQSAQGRFNLPPLPAGPYVITVYLRGPSHTLEASAPFQVP